MQKKFFTLPKPELKELQYRQTLAKILGSKERKTAFSFLKRVSGQEYLYWDKMRYKEPAPENFSKEELWVLIKVFRESEQINTIIKDQEGNFFTWSKLDYFEEFFHELDMNMGGELFIENGQFTKANKQKLISRGIMEEAIASSQLEGAATSRLAAKKMLQEHRRPTNHSEQMILNNYLSMQAIEDRYKDEKMSMEAILELHQFVTHDTRDSENETPRLRKGDEPVYIIDKTGLIYYEAPNASFVKNELIRLIKFANDEFENQTFIHPIVKAIMLHFWLGYLHPFTDGNGRLARLLFYWYLRKKGYWAFAYLPISKIIKRAPKQYIMAYVYSEQDDNDLNYFVDYNIRKIKLAIDDFKKYLANQVKSNIQMKQKSEVEHGLNIRQVQLLQYLYGHSEERTTLKAHMGINQVAKMTASKDLKDLVKKDFLLMAKSGRNVYYYGTEKLSELF